MAAAELKVESVELGSAAYEGALQGYRSGGPEGVFNGFVESLIFMNNTETVEPDEIDGEAIVAGNITVTD